MVVVQVFVLLHNQYYIYNIYSIEVIHNILKQHLSNMCLLCHSKSIWCVQFILIFDMMGLQMKKNIKKIFVKLEKIFLYN